MNDTILVVVMRVLVVCTLFDIAHTLTDIAMSLNDIKRIVGNFYLNLKGCNASP